MNLILTLPTRSEAVIEILCLLLVAGFIGYVTAWLYAKWVYSKKMNEAENSRNELKIQIATQNAILNRSEKAKHNKEEEYDHLLLEVAALKALHAEAVHETDEMTIKNTRSEQLLYEKDEALIHIAQRKHLLNYASFGKASYAEMDDLKMISGIGPFIEERLHALDIFTFRQISKFTAMDIETINYAIEYFSGRIERDDWVAQAAELVHTKDKRDEMLRRIRERRGHIYYNRIGIAKMEEADDLTVISGIGGWIQQKLNVLDIFTFRQISNFTDEDIKIVTDAIEFFPGRIERDEWIPQAEELVRIAGKKAELHQRILSRKDRIYYDRLGMALKHEANNLTLIKGIGLWIEERLNLTDIYTFDQISKLTPADIETITEILEISPGRIERDNWVSQARVLANKKTVQEAI